MATQTRYARSLLAAVMNNIVFTQEHASVVGRCCRRMYEKTFAQKKLKKQPTLKMLRAEIKEELDKAKTAYDQNIIRPIYNSLEEYTEGACDMLSRPSNVRFDERLVGFGLKNVPEDNWEAVMLTVMHYTSARMEYNQKERRAVHFIVDETQVLSKKGTSADQLNTAVATFRKFGGICTMAMQNLTAALHNEQLKELFSNCSYKCFLDQGGVDANALAEIQELSQTEFAALSSDEPGKGVMVWGKKVVLFDARVSKDNPLYGLISTDFHGEEKAKEKDEIVLYPMEEETEPAEEVHEEKGIRDGRKKKRGEIRRRRKEAGSYKKGDPVRESPAGHRPSRRTPEEHPDRASQIILQMASYQDVSLKDILCILENIPEAGILEKLNGLMAEGRLILVDTPSGVRYRKGR